MYIYIYKQDLALNNPLVLMCQKTTTNETDKIKVSSCNVTVIIEGKRLDESSSIRGRDSCQSTSC